jgi:hypothetical protein
MLAHFSLDSLDIGNFLVQLFFHEMDFLMLVLFIVVFFRYSFKLGVHFMKITAFCVFLEESRVTAQTHCQ